MPKITEFTEHYNKIISAIQRRILMTSPHPQNLETLVLISHFRVNELPFVVGTPAGCLGDHVEEHTGE